MKKILLFTCVGILIGFIIGGSIILICCTSLSRENRIKPEYISDTAFLVDGYDGYYRMDLIEIRSDTIRFKIYEGMTSRLIYDADFISENCNSLSLTTINWSDSMIFYDDKCSICTISLNNIYCQLIALQPAYFKRE